MSADSTLTDRIRVLDVVPAPRPARDSTTVGLARRSGRRAAPAVDGDDRATAGEREGRGDLDGAGTRLGRGEVELDGDGADGLEDGHGEVACRGRADGVGDAGPGAHARVGRVHRLDLVCVLEPGGRPVKVADLPDVRRALRKEGKKRGGQQRGGR